MKIGTAIAVHFSNLLYINSLSFSCCRSGGSWLSISSQGRFQSYSTRTCTRRRVGGDQKPWRRARVRLDGVVLLRSLQVNEAETKQLKMMARRRVDKQGDGFCDAVITTQDGKWEEMKQETVTAC